jgi:hypothetical protein
MEEQPMAKKKILNMKFKLVLKNDDGTFNGVNEFTPNSAGDLLGNIRKGLNAIYGFPVDDSEPKGFQNLQINSFNMIDVETEDIDTAT